MSLPAFPVPDLARLERIRRTLNAAEYNETTLADIFARAKNAALSHPVSRARWEYATRARSPLHSLIRLFGLHLAEPANEVEACLGSTALQDFLASGLLVHRENSIAAQVQLYPFMGRLFAGDLPQYHHHSQGILALSSPAATIAQLMIRRPIDGACDLGTGCGVLAILAAECSRSVVATDLNPRALELAQLNAGLNGAGNVETRLGNWFEPIQGDTFDLLVSNPPFLISPETDLMFRDGANGDSVTKHLLQGIPQHLNDGGFAQVICNVVHTSDGDGAVRVKQWTAGSGCNVWVLSFGADDVAAYAEEWIRETADGDAERFEKWMQYYEQNNITAISSCVVLMRKRSGSNWFVYETMPERIGLCGDAVLQGFAQRDAVHFDDDALLQTKLHLAGDARLEQHLEPSDQEWSVEKAYLGLKSGLSWKAAVDANLLKLATAFGKPCSATDAIQSIAKQFGVSVDQITASALPAIREMISNGILACHDES